MGGMGTFRDSYQEVSVNAFIPRVYSLQTLSFQISLGTIWPGLFKN